MGRSRFAENVGRDASLRFCHPGMVWGGEEKKCLPMINTLNRLGVQWRAQSSLVLEQALF